MQTPLVASKPLGRGATQVNGSWSVDCPTADPSILDAVAANLSSTATAGSAGGTGLTQVLYLQEPGDKAAISVSDLHQGQIGDCFLISSIGELALTHPSAITNMITINKSGSETVTLYMGTNGYQPLPGATAYKQVKVPVTNVFPSYSVNCGATQCVVGNQKEIWPQVLEKAVATMLGGYNAIANGGNPVLAMQELTGHPAQAYMPSRVSPQMLTGFAQAGDLICFDTIMANNLPNHLVGCHAYMYEGTTTSGGQTSVTLGNPWGTCQPDPIPFSQLCTAGIQEIDVGRFT